MVRLRRSLTAVAVVILAVAMMGASAPSLPPTAAAAHSWGEPAWADEFNGVRLSPDWLVYDSPGHAGNGLRRPSQVTVADGAVTHTGTPDGTGAGMVIDSPAVFHRYGRWETRQRTTQDNHAGRPYHAVTALIPGGSQPYHCGAMDLDYAEYDIGAPVYVFLHNLPDRQHYLAVTHDTTQWHTYALEVTPRGVSWYVDGRVVVTDRDPRIVSHRLLAPNFQLDAYQPGGLNLGTLEVDWTRYYPLSAGSSLPPAPAPLRGIYNGAC